MRKLRLIALLAALALLLSGGSAYTEETPAPDAAADDRLQLTIFEYDKCGGCGVDSPGCGNCQQTVVYHGIIKEQLGNRLYDGTIHYRMLNCRLLSNERDYYAHFDSYGLPEELYGFRPVIFIGDGTSGVYLIGEKMLDYVGEYVDKYLLCEDDEAKAALQAEINELRATLYPEE